LIFNSHETPTLEDQISHLKHRYYSQNFDTPQLLMLYYRYLRHPHIVLSAWNILSPIIYIFHMAIQNGKKTLFNLVRCKMLESTVTVCNSSSFQLSAVAIREITQIYMNRQLKNWSAQWYAYSYVTWWKYAVATFTSDKIAQKLKILLQKHDQKHVLKLVPYLLHPLAFWLPWLEEMNRAT